MKLMLDISIPSPPIKIDYSNSLMIIGSCFTEHIGGRLSDLKFNTLQNPNGILFDPVSVSNSITSYVDDNVINGDNLYYHNELYHSWQHHSHFSGTDKDHVIDRINKSTNNAHHFLKTANWLIITLGSAFHYIVKEQQVPVANCHRVPSQVFTKELLEIDSIYNNLLATIDHLRLFNPGINIILTISPVRHIREGVTENNRSKARLIEAVHKLVKEIKQVYYFPAYELVIDVLRDYRFYDIDLVHPNYAATEFVFDKFSSAYISEDAIKLMHKIREVVTAFKHKPFQRDTQAHKAFLESSYKKVLAVLAANSNIDLKKEISYFSS